MLAPIKPISTVLWRWYAAPSVQRCYRFDGAPWPPSRGWGKSLDPPEASWRKQTVHTGLFWSNFLKGPQVPIYIYMYMYLFI